MRQLILEKATEMFLTLGVKSITMDDLAQALSISKKTIYQHFRNKTSLVEAVAFNLFDTICAGIEQITACSINPLDELFHIRNMILEHLNSERSSPHYQLQKYYPKVFEQLKWKQFEVMKKCVEENMAKGIEQGLYRKNMDVEFMIRIYFSSVLALKDPEIFPVERFTADYLNQAHLEYHLRATCTEKGLKILNHLMKKQYSEL